MGLKSSQIKYGNCIETSDARAEADTMQMQGLRLLPACGASVFVEFRVEGNLRRQRVLQMTKVISATVNSFDYTQSCLDH